MQINTRPTAAAPLALAALGALAVAAPSAEAQIVQTFTNAASAAGFGDPGNSVFTFDYSGPDFLIGTIDVTGTVLNQGDPLADPAFEGNFLSDGIIDITRSDRDPNVDFAVVGGSSAGAVASDTFANFDQDSGELEGTSAVGSYRVEFFENGFFGGAFDEVDGTDNLFTTVTITINEFVEPELPTFRPAEFDADGRIMSELDAEEVEFYSFDYDGDADLLFSTLGTDLAPNNDTELALYDADGEVVATDDDSGSFLSAIVVNGGILPAGEYTLAVGGFNTTFDANFQAESTSQSSGPLVITGLSLIPEPATAGLLVPAGLALLARRRRGA